MYYRHYVQTTSLVKFDKLLIQLAHYIDRKDTDARLNILFLINTYQLYAALFFNFNLMKNIDCQEILLTDSNQQIPFWLPMIIYQTKIQFLYESHYLFAQSVGSNVKTCFVLRWDSLTYFTILLSVCGIHAQISPPKWTRTVNIYHIRVGYFLCRMGLKYYLLSSKYLCYIRGSFYVLSFLWHEGTFVLNTVISM